MPKSANCKFDYLPAHSLLLHKAVHVMVEADQ